MLIVYATRRYPYLLKTFSVLLSLDGILPARDRNLSVRLGISVQFYKKCFWSIYFVNCTQLSCSIASLSYSTHCLFNTRWLLYGQPKPSTYTGIIASLWSAQPINIHYDTRLLYGQPNPSTSIKKHGCSMVNPTYQDPLQNIVALWSTQTITIYGETWLLYVNPTHQHSL